MDVAEGIFTVPDLLTPEECLEYIALTEAIGYTAAPITTAGGFKMRPEIRNNTRVIVDDADRAAELWGRLRDHVPPFLRGRPTIGLNERFRFYRYDPGERFAPHRDGSYRRENGEESLLTFMVYLSEGFDGGETAFPGASVTPRIGGRHPGAQVRPALRRHVRARRPGPRLSRAGPVTGARSTPRTAALRSGASAGRRGSTGAAPRP
jgi:hypothetical protein